MIKTKDVLIAVNRKLKKDFTGYEVKSTDNRKNVAPGSFYVETPMPIMDGSKDFRHEHGTIRICYFPKNEKYYREEFMDMQEKLSMSFFSILEITEDFVIPINELEFEESDDVLIASFDYEMWQSVSEEGEDMENLEIR